MPIWLASSSPLRHDPKCKRPPRFTVWLDPRPVGLEAPFDLPHTVQACADDVVILAAPLRAKTVKPKLLKALLTRERSSSRDEAGW